MIHSRLRALVIVMCVLGIATAARAANEPTAIYTMNVDGSAVRQLVRIEGLAEHASPRWSNDGKRVVFDAMPAEGGERKIHIVHADGTGLREIGLGSMPTWSPDDKQIACHSLPATGRAQLFVQNPDGAGRTQLGMGNSPRWSPDGSKLATSDGKKLYVIDAITGESESVFPDPYFELFRGFDWSPDGKTLAVAVRGAQGAKRDLLFVNAAGAGKGLTKRLSSGLGGFVSFSPGGQQLVYASDQKIYIVDVDSKNPPRLVPGQRGKNRNPDWSPDGKKIVFVSDRDTK